MRDVAGTGCTTDNCKYMVDCAGYTTGTRKDGTVVGNSQFAMLELTRSGTATKWIRYKNYPGETPVWDWATLPTPGASGTGNTLIYGLRGAQAPTGVCSAGANVDKACLTDSDCTGGVCNLTGLPTNSFIDYYTSLEGIKATNFDYWDRAENKCEFGKTCAGGTNNYAAQFFFLSGVRGGGSPRNVALRNTEVTGNEGGCTIETASTAGVRYEYNNIHDNITHCWGTIISFIGDKGYTGNAMGVVRGNSIHDNEDDSPIYALDGFCDGQNSECVGASDPYPCCTGSGAGNCNAAGLQLGNVSGNQDGVDRPCSGSYYDVPAPEVAGKGRGPQGYGCWCNRNANCTSGVCYTAQKTCNGGGSDRQNCNLPGTTCAGGAACGNGVTGTYGQCVSGTDIGKQCCPGGGTCETMGNGLTKVGSGFFDTEGRGIIIDGGLSGNLNSAVLIENNDIYDNEGECISVFLSDKVIFRNNNCRHNSIRPKPGIIGTAQSTEVYTVGNDVWLTNNLIEAGSYSDNGVTKNRTAFQIIGPSLWTHVNFATDLEMYNKIISANTTTPVCWNTSCGTLAQYVTGMASTGGIYGTGTTKETDFLWVDAPTDFHITDAGSPANNAGYLPYLPAQDKEQAV